ncbi:MAG: DUF434 domain-containing protein [Lachnospiraceae bacterium]|nr:DUF434 domain-containing protein [Lachnospiraceae bacterium]MBQ7777107.1 DUF434 domain-containing protein [Lachnospiraceae bacterium]
MAKSVKRGYVPSDEKEFGEKELEKLHKAGEELYYLANRGYQMKMASTFVGNHYLLSERQRLALVRSISPKESIEARRSKEIKEDLDGCVVNIDGFNTIITLEIAFSDSLLLKCMDGTIRDLAGLRGTYRLIDKTERAIVEIGRLLERKKVKKAVFYLDAPVSNSGRLKELILQCLSEVSFEVQIEIIHNVDSVLETLENVVTGDAIILDKCKSWYNLTKVVIEEAIGEYHFVDFEIEE